jgi:DNA repair exonuclease SbcCD ATPase subunit
MNKDIVKNLNRIRNIVENIKSVENLQKMLEKIEDMVSKGRETKAEMDRLAGKAERFYVEIENRLREFSKFKAKVERLDELTKEIMKTVDEINIKISGLSSKEDMENFKKSVNEIISSTKKKIDERVKSIEDVLRVPPADVVAKTKSLENKKKKILKLLENVEEQYRKALITQKTYEEIKEKNKSILEKIEKELKKLKAKEKPLLKDIPSIVENLSITVKTTEAKIISLEKKIEEQNGLIQKLYEEFGRFKEGVELSAPLKAQVEMTRNMLEKFKALNEKLDEIAKTLTLQEYRIRFFEILNALVRTQKTNEIPSLISQLDTVIAEMKENNIWNKNTQELTEGLLTEIGENWRRYGYEDVARIFDSEVEKLKTEIHKYMLTY